MALFTVEKQGVFLRPSKREVTPRGGPAHEQEHLYVMTRRLPWRNNPKQRTMGFMDSSQFGGLDKPGNIRNFDRLRSTLFGSGATPKVIISDISPGEVYVKQDLLHKLVSQYNVRNRTSYKPHYSNWKEIGSVWMMADPTRSGRVSIPATSGLRASQMVMGWPVVVSHKQFIQEGYREFRGEDPEPEDYAAKMKAYRNEPRGSGSKIGKAKFRQSNPKKYQKKTVLYLGAVYVVRYWPTRVPVDLYWSEGIQRRVRAHLAHEMKQRGTLPLHPSNKPLSRYSHPVDVKGMTDWYVMGIKQAPSVSSRFKETPRGRIKDMYTYHTTKGFVPLTTDMRESLRPLFVVKGRNVEAARVAAEDTIDKLIRNAATADRGYDLSERWLASGKKMISRASLRKYRER